MNREWRYIGYIILMIALLAGLLLIAPGCAHYKAEIHPDGSGYVNIWSTREFPEGMKTSYKDFSFEANAVSGGLTLEDVLNVARFLEAKGIPLAPVGESQ